MIMVQKMKELCAKMEGRLHGRDELPAGPGKVGRIWTETVTSLSHQSA